MSDIQTIRAFGTEFRYSKARDREVIIDANGYINYSKLLAQISGQNEKLRLLCKDNSDIFANVYEYEKEKIDAYLRKTAKPSVRGIPRTEENNVSLRHRTSTSVNDEIITLPKTMTVSQLVEANVFIVYNGGTHRELWGTYGPRYLIDIFIIFTDAKYYKRIHETLEAIDAYAIANNKSFAGELERLKEQYEEKLKRLSILMKERDNVIKHERRAHKSTRAILAEIKAQNE